MTNLLSKIQHEVVVTAGILTAAGEAVVLQLPAGPVHTILVAALPVVAGIAARAKTMSLASVDELIASIKTATSKSSSSATSTK